LYVPSIGLIVGGDAVYNGIHPHLSETDTQSRLEWISTLDKLEALKSKAVVAGHKVPESLCALGALLWGDALFNARPKAVQHRAWPIRSAGTIGVGPP
jgi:hypothetical protein